MGMLDDQSIIITGAGRGLGRAYALAVAAAGANTVLNDLDPDCLEEVAEEIRKAGGSTVTVQGSVSDWDAAGRLVETAREQFGAIDGLVNNAGLFRAVDAPDEIESELRKLVEVNILGAFFVGTHAMRAMRDQGHGVIVNASSGAHLGIAQQGIYGATKGALTSATYSWALDMKPHGVRVNAISPLALTRMADNYALPGLDRAAMPRPEEIAPMVVFLLSKEADFTGQVLRLDGKTINLLSQPHYDAGRGITDPSGWTAEAIASAWRERLSLHVKSAGMAAYTDD